MNDSGITASDFVKGLRQNLVAYLSTLSIIPGVVIEKTDNLMRAATGTPVAFMNPVVSTGVITDVERCVAETDSFFQSRELPYAWYDLNDIHSASLNDHLLNTGATFISNMPGMCVALKEIEDNTELPVDLDIIVAGDDEMQMWNDITSVVYGIPAEVQSDYAKFMVQINQISEMKCYVGLLNEVPVATVMMLYSQNAAGLYSVATMPAARNRGIGAAVTRRAMLDAKSDGYPMAVLEASQMGESIYRRLGFIEYCKIGLYMKFKS